jgi:glycosyltransferase involved in cell wall biosynthesis
MRDAPEGMRLMFVGQLFTHKNIQIVIEAMREVRGHLPAATLFITGPPAQGPEEAPGMVYLGAVPDRALREAYELATLLVMPSLYETIGLPMPESMSVGTPVLAADRPYAHDVCEDAACFFDPLSPRDCAEQIVRLLTDRGLHSSLRQRGLSLVERRRASRPFERMLKTTLAVAKGRQRPTDAAGRPKKAPGQG